MQKPTHRFDAIDAERFHAMASSEAFHRFTARVTEMLAVASRDCENELEASKLRRAQGQAIALRAVLRLPDQILREIRQSLKP